jgi:hypothetical protein
LLYQKTAPKVTILWATSSFEKMSLKSSPIGKKSPNLVILLTPQEV